MTPVQKGVAQNQASHMSVRPMGCLLFWNNIIRKNQLKRNTGIVINKLFIDEDELNIYEYLSDGIDILEKFIVYDDLHNNENPVIKSITKIISTYKLPESGLKTWIKSLLLNKGYKHQEIANSLRILKTLY